MSKLIDRTGQRFSRLMVISLGPKIGPKKRTTWNCICDCGKIVVVHQDHLSNGHTRSCGCIKVEITSKRNHKHGNSIRSAETKEYRAWTDMITRCNNPKFIGYKNYGGRGISVCEKWHNSFEKFLADVGPSPSNKHSIDRYPNHDGNYEPGNVRWATQREQHQNRRNTILLEYNGKFLDVFELSKLTGIPEKTIRNRKSKNWSDSDCVLPINFRRNKIYK